ncbi:hypothetical protein [Maribacter sp. 1_2014MBL_MicDiv]|uniref:hypothetical protein n=1 Tax=Maribacter sp. 1_2014MBL_MicDiv TaxID=1644130 RepID=UPI0008F47827|nr:hypothetical protein [Maribacter sp. 1_2014MBL_MicDiv]APA65651.1 hypothetical protein YQ22_15815 [Maribacter sp. 1_2014MBL_MicDiv]
MSSILQEVKSLRTENEILLKKQNQAIELTVALRERIESLLNPPIPEHVNIKTACMLLGRSHAVVYGYIKDAGIQPSQTLGRSKSYRYSDIQDIANRLGIRLQKLSA